MLRIPLARRVRDVAVAPAVPLLLLLLGGGSEPARAQGATGSVRGRITDARTQRPIADVQVSVTGTTTGGVTGVDGQYALLAVPVGDYEVVIRRIGYTRAVRRVTVSAGQATTLDVALGEAASNLDQVVVTGTVESVEKRVLGNAITQLDVAALTTKATVMNVTEILQAKTPGVQLLPGSGTPGTGADIRIRGAGSLTASVRPVFFIDGVRFNDASTGNFLPAAAGVGAGAGQVTSALDLISPNDIESIEVIKGPAAATLYGADAAGGVIQIITKKGARGQQRTRWTLRADLGQNDVVLWQPDNYTFCDSARVAGRDAAGNPTWPGCAEAGRGALLTDNPFRRTPTAFRSGEVSRYSLSARGGADRISYFLSFDRDIENGVQFNSFNNRTAGRANVGVQLARTLDVSLQFNYTDTRVRLPLGDEAGNGILLSGNRGRPGAAPGGTGDAGWRTVLPDSANKYNNQTATSRVIVGSTVNWTPASWLRSRLTIGFDRSTGLATLVSEPTSVDTPAGLSAQRVPRANLFTLDWAANADYALRRDVQTTTTAGIQVVANRSENLFASGTGLGAPDVTTIQSATTITASSAFTENNSVGYFVQERIGWRNRLFGTFALRADDNSAFGTDFDIIVYPKVSVAWVASDEPALRTLMDRVRADDVKLRAAWGQAGRAPAPYSATRTYTVDRVTLGSTTGSALRTAAFGNPNLEPERGDEVELGFDASFVGGRLTAEFTWYRKRTDNLLFAQPIAPSLGFAGSQLTNLGAIRNSGVELAVTGTPVRGDRVAWEVQANLQTNDNRMVDFGVPGKTNEVPASQAYGVVQEIRKGFPLGAYWVNLPRRNPDGSPVLNAAGAVQFDTAKTYIGPSVPTRELGLFNTVTLFRYVRVYAALDYKGGHYQFNGKERNRCQPANDNCARNNDPRVRAPRTRADSLLARELPVWRTALDPFIERADFVKLRDLSLTLTVPDVWLRRMRSAPATAALTITGRNLAMWTDYSGVDPEVNTYGNRNPFVRVDQYAMPMTRRVQVSVNLTY